MFGLNRLSIQSKMILLLLAVALSSLAIMAWIGFQSGKSALERAVENQLRGIQVAKTSALTTKLESLRDQVISMSDSRMVIEGMKAFDQAFEQIPAESANRDVDEGLRMFYANSFIPDLRKNIEADPVIEQYLPSNSSARYLQYHSFTHSFREP